MHRVRRVGSGIQIGDEKLSILMYADDIVIMTESREDMQECLNAVETYANDFKVKSREDMQECLNQGSQHFHIFKKYDFV